MENQTINQVVIVGGGTAGWLTAAKLAKHLNSRDPEAVQVTLVESPDIPTIGVGEGTWPTMRKTLSELGIDENYFMTFCQASFKQATKFVNWKSTPKAQKNNQYYHLFSSVVSASEFNLSPYWSLSDKQQDYASYVSPQAAICEQNLAPKLITTRAYEGIMNYAYHLDAGKFALLLKEFSCTQLGVKHIQANVEELHRNQHDLIESITTDTAGIIEGQLFVDCSGFNCLLLGKTYGIKFKPINDILLTDHAIAIQVPYSDPNQEVKSATISTAHDAGWTWDIGLNNRRGTGYVYCSDFVSHEQAEQTLRDYIGPEAENLSAKQLKMHCGYREKFWHKNCVAIGLSAAFVEPLEASAIFLIEASANMLCEQFPRHMSLLPIVEQKFNQSFLFRWQKTIDFIKLHYFLSQRKEAFWQENRRLDSVPDSLQLQLENWKRHPVSQYDFSHVYEPFLQDSYQYVLHGMEYGQDLSYNQTSFNQQQTVTQLLNKKNKMTDALLSQLGTNRQLLRQVAEFGFQAV